MDEEMSRAEKIGAWIMIILITVGFGIFAYASQFYFMGF